jgi:hypothetical protein
MDEHMFRSVLIILFTYSHYRLIRRERAAIDYLNTRNNDNVYVFDGNNGAQTTVYTVVCQWA